MEACSEGSAELKKIKCLGLHVEQSGRLSEVAVSKVRCVHHRKCARKIHN